MLSCKMKMHKRNIGCILAFHFIYQSVHIGNKTKNVTYHVFKRHIL